jgi:hypothetical protein
MTTSWLLDLPAQNAQRDGNAVAPTVRTWNFVGFDVTYDAATDTVVIRRAGDYKDSVRAATAAALPANTISGNTITADANGALPAVDGVTLIVGDEFLSKDEGASDLRHGVYVLDAAGEAGVSPWAATRRADFNESSDVTAEVRVPVAEGTTNEGKVFVLTTNDPIVLNTTALSFSVFEAGISGDVGADDNRIVRTDGTGGDTIQASGITIDDTDSMTGLGSLTMTGTIDMTADGNVRMEERAAAPASAAANGDVYVRDVSGVAELHYQDDTGQEVQLTDNGSIIGGTTVELADNTTTAYLISNQGADWMRLNTSDGGEILTFGHSATSADSFQQCLVRCADNTNAFIVERRSGGENFLAINMVASGTITFGNTTDDPEVFFSTAAAINIESYLNHASALVLAANDVGFITGTDADVKVFVPLLQFGLDETAPVITQADNVTASGTGEDLTVRAQSATGTTSTGGNLVFEQSSGTSNNGDIVFQDTVAGALLTFPGSSAVVEANVPVRIDTRAVAPSTAGDVRLGHLGTITERNAANSANVSIAGLDASNYLHIGGVLDGVRPPQTYVDGTSSVQLRSAGTNRIECDTTGVGFFNVAPVARAAAYTQTYSTATRTHAALTSATLTDSTGGTANTTVVAITAVGGSGATTTQEGEINDNFADLIAQVNALRVDLENAKQMINSLVDDAQAYGLAQ